MDKPLCNHSVQSVPETTAGFLSRLSKQETVTQVNSTPYVHYGRTGSAGSWSAMLCAVSLQSPLGLLPGT